MRNLLKPTLAGFCLPLCLLACAAEEAAPPAEPPLRPVRYEQVTAGSGGQLRRFSAVSKAGLSTRMSFKVSGTIEQLAIKVGDTLSKGQLLAALNAADYRLQVQQAEASLGRVQAEARNARASYARVQALYENDSAARNELDAARAAAESSEALVSSARQQLALNRQQLSYTRLTAPHGGCAVAQLFVERNENVSPGQVVAELACGDTLEVQASVAETFIADIKIGDTVKVGFAALSGSVLPAVVSEVGLPSAGRTTYPVTVALQSSDPRLRAGMAAEVAFTVPGDNSGIVVPSVSVGEDERGRHVYVVEPGEAGTGVVHRREVSVGKLLAEGFVIKDGLQVGELVVTAGVSRLHDGRKVRLLAQ